LAADVGLEHPLDNRRLGRLDHHAARRRQAVCANLTQHPVAETQAAAAMSGAHPPLQATMGLLGEVLQEQRRHRTPRADMQLRDVTFRQGDHPHAGEGQMLVEAGDVLLVATDTIQRLGDDDIEAGCTGICHQLLEARPARRGAADRIIRVDINDRPTLALGPRPADPDLIVDRGLTLVVGRIPGIDRSAHCDSEE
jgi:hypothetical protein